MGLFDEGDGGDYYGDYAAEGGGFGDFNTNFDFQMPDINFDFEPGPLMGGAPYGAEDVAPFNPGQEYGPFFGGNTGLPGGAPAAFDQNFASPESGYYYDTTSGSIQSPTGQQISVEDYLRGAGEPGQGGVPSAPGGQVGYSSGGGQAFLPSGQPGEPQKSEAEQGGIFGGLEKFLGSNIGRAITAGGIGLAGLGAARAIAGGPTKANLPTYQQSPQTIAGQAALAPALQAQINREARAAREQNPAERALRMQALGMAPGLLQQGGGMADPVQAALQAEILGTLNNPQGGVSPATNQRQQAEEQALRNRLATQLGRDYELTTPGIQALNELQQRQNAERFSERQATIARISPLEESRLGGQDVRRRAALGDVTGISQGLGRTGFGQGIGYFGSPEQANQMNVNLGTQAAMANFGAREQSRRDLIQGISGVAGMAAGALTQPKDPYADFFKSQFTKAYGFV